VNAGVRFVTEMCKMRAFVDLWEEIGRERYGVTDTRALMFRYGVQVNSLGLTEPQPENNVYRILIEALAVTLSKRARCRALQLPAWNEALGLPRPWDQQWSLRLQQILAYETDLLEYEDLFDGSHVVTAKTEALKTKPAPCWRSSTPSGGTIDNIDFMKTALVESQRARLKEIEAGRQIVVGVNRYETTETSPLSGGDGSIMAQDHGAESRQIAKLKAWRSKRAKTPSPTRSASSAPPPPAAPTSCRPPSPPPKPASPWASGAPPCAKPSANTAGRPASPSSSRPMARKISRR
jgi:(2R)-ethylmalonyl-CoA mutase